MSGFLQSFAAVMSLAASASAAAIPPYPPAQKGSRVSTYHCPGDTLILTESWASAASSGRQRTISINGKSLSRPDALTIANEIAAFGYIQNNTVVCTRRGPELILIRYTLTAGQLHLSFKEGSLVQIGLSDDSTGHKRTYRTPSK